MTCIVGLEHEGKVYMGGDRCASTSAHKMTVDKPKIFEKGDCIFGYTTSFRFADILQYHLIVPKHPKTISDDTYMVLYLVENIRECLKRLGFAEVSENKEEGGNCLIGYRGKLYEMQSDFSIVRAQRGFNSVGSGEEYARGSLVTTEYVDNLTPEKRVELALHSAAECAPGVMPPFDIICKEWKINDKSTVKRKTKRTQKATRATKTNKKGT